MEGKGRDGKEGKKNGVYDKSLGYICLEGGKGKGKRETCGSVW